MQNFLTATNTTLLIILGALLLWNIFLQWRLEKTRQRIKVFFKGRKTKDLEEVIAEHLKRTKKSEEEIKKLQKWNKDLQKIANISVQKIGVVRFNPFKDTGGDQSFSIALLDSQNSGLVVSGLYARGETRVYVKPIEKQSSTYQLSEEEKEAIQKAMK